MLQVDLICFVISFVFKDAAWTRCACLPERLTESREKDVPGSGLDPKKIIISLLYICLYVLGGPLSLSQALLLCLYCPEVDRLDLMAVTNQLNQGVQQPMQGTVPRALRQGLC